MVLNMIKKAFKFYALPMYILIHPFDGFYNMKFQNEGTVKLAVLNFLLVCLSLAFRTQYASIIVNLPNPVFMNSFIDLLMVAGALLLFCVGNWSVTTLTDGEGRFKDIFMAVCYAMTPLVLTIIPATLLSNVLAAEEVGFYYMLLGVGMFYFVFLTLIGLVTIHNYGAIKTLVTIMLTFIAILIIVFLLTLLFTLWQQLVTFVYSVYTELMFR